MRLLVVKLSSLGDIVHTFPAVAEARANCPELEIDWLADRPFVDLVHLCPGITDVIANDALRAGTRWWGKTALGAMRAGALDLASRRYDLVIDAQGLLRSAILARGAGAPIAGFDGGAVREWPAHLAYRKRVAVPRTLHACERLRRLFGAALNYVPATGAAAARRAHPATTDRQVLLLHGTAQRAKQWPFAHWRAVAAHLAATGRVPVVTGGNAEELQTCAQLAAQVPGTRILAGMSLAELAREIDQMALVVSVDTGLGHLADARGVPTIMLFQASDPRLTGPIHPASRAVWAGDVPRRPPRRERNRPPLRALVDPAAAIAAIEEALR